MQYPSDIDQTNSPFMIFSAFKWDVRGRSEARTNIKEDSKEDVVLPIPSNGLSETINSKWEEETGLLFTAGEYLGGSVIVKSIIRGAKEMLGDLLKHAEYKEGVTVNDFASIFYDGQDFREFTFEFDLIPKSEQEANTILDIVNFFKKHQLSNKDGNYKITYPSFFRIEANFPELGQIFKFKEAVISSFTATYFSEESLGVHKTGHPLKTHLTMTFKELEKIYKKDFE